MTVVLFASCLISVLSCFVVARLFERVGWVDMPTARASHSRPTPKGGGIGLVLAFCGTSFFLQVPVVFWMPGFLLAGLSFVNDVRDLSARIRLLAQAGAACVTLGYGVWAEYVVWPIWLLPLAVFFVVATTNCYNFMDGINGMAGISGLVAFTLLQWHQGFDPSLYHALPLAGITGALIGFLPFNVPKARLFMGDVGSIYLGFVFAVSICVMAETWTDFLVLSSFLFTFFADEAVTVVERLFRRESLLVPHRRHLYQFFVNELGMPHWKVSLAYALVQSVFAMAIMYMSQFGFEIVCVALVSAVFFWSLAHWSIKFYFNRDR